MTVQYTGQISCQIGLVCKFEQHVTNVWASKIYLNIFLSYLMTFMCTIDINYVECNGGDIMQWSGHPLPGKFQVLNFLPSGKLHH